MNWNPQSLDADWPFDILATNFELRPDTTALLVIDMQAGELEIAADSPLAQRYPEIASYWSERLSEKVLPNAARLIAAFRARQCKIIYTRNGSSSTSGDEVTPRLQQMRGGQPPASHRGSAQYQIAQQLAPTRADLVVDKFTSGAFTASTLDHALRNMKMESVVIAGILTDACVLGTARVATELGYNSLICEDACATLTQRAHDEALLMHARIFGRVETTQGVLCELFTEPRP